MHLKLGKGTIYFILNCIGASCSQWPIGMGFL